MESLIEKIAYCVEFGKVDRQSPYPPDMKDQDGADELTKQALDENMTAKAILNESLVPAMSRVGKKFKANEIFVPQVLMSAKAMKAAMAHLKPFFQSGDIQQKGTFVIGTVAGDLHDIGKNLVSMMIEGGGWNVVDLGTDVKTEEFVKTIDENPGAVIGLSALLATTMVNMQSSVKEIKEQKPDTKILIGGAPVTDEFRKEIGADFYSPDPQGAVDYLNSMTG
ncbi:MAG: B12-binding domain-containing protein [candidate division KSB1 bacterium]|nr:B12-binding domain-containing protein [candidate division KSB1 bacterium]